MNTFFELIRIEAVGVALIVVTYAFVLSLVFGQQKRRRRERHSELFSTVTTGLVNATITTLEDMLNVYRGIMKIPSDDVTYPPGLSSFLRDLLVQIVGGKVAAKHLKTDILALKEKVTAFLRTAEEETPYADLPDIERAIISDIRHFAESGEPKEIRRKLAELASSIQVRAQEQTRAERLNRWTVPIAAVGLVLTAVFGFLSVP